MDVVLLIHDLNLNVVTGSMQGKWKAQVCAEDEGSSQPPSLLYGFKAVFVINRTTKGENFVLSRRHGLLLETEHDS
jgi:hypothetical protein